MLEVIRKDSFSIGGPSKLAPGFYVLKKSQPAERNAYLDQLYVVESSEQESVTTVEHAGVVADSNVRAAVQDGDIGFVSSKGNLRVVMSKNANHNTLLVTERCNNLCLFCSQPPVNSDDEWLLTQSAMALAAFQSKETVGISGGEPLLYGDTFVRFLEFVARHSPETPLHILSNGRAFHDSVFAAKIAAHLNSLQMAFGVPLYAASSDLHDRLVGCSGAFSETVLGLINAGNSGIPIELRVVPTQWNYQELPSIVELAARCFSNIAQISIMNMEPMGWAKQSWSKLYIKPESYWVHLKEAIDAAERAAIPTTLFNYPLCHLDDELWLYATPSISDWKNYFPESCNSCSKKTVCSGYFSSAKGAYFDPPRGII